MTLIECFEFYCYLVKTQGRKSANERLIDITGISEKDWFFVELQSNISDTGQVLRINSETNNSYWSDK